MWEWVVSGVILGHLGSELRVKFAGFNGCGISCLGKGQGVGALV